MGLESIEVSREAKELFIAFVGSVVRGEPLVFESVLREHPALAEQLIALRGRWMPGIDLPEPDTRGSLFDRIRGYFGHDAVPEVLLPAARDEEHEIVPSVRLLARLASRKDSLGRYRVKGEIAQGGMGSIVRVWDQDLRRDLAMKVILGKRSDTSRAQPDIDSKTLSRFLGEAQVTGQLEHPGVVPVHDLGLDANGHVFFTMQLVKGRDLKPVFEQVHAGSDEWTLTRTLGVFVKVCETLAFAHSKGVVHRDIKPANIMVGRFGETYVMDWGLARVLGQPDLHDIRPRRDTGPESRAIESVRLADRTESPDSPLLTEDGTALGTPAYMAPEQARGMVHMVGPRSDVYSVGAMLYHLLSGEVPYLPPGSKLTPREVLALVMLGPPRPLTELAPDAPAELVAIADKAMARDGGRRYADTMEIARDLEAYLGRRPISAVSHGLGYVLRLAIQRNKPVAATAAAAFVVVVVLLAFFIRNLQDAVRKTNSALHDNERLIDVLAAPALLEASENLYPLLPDTAPRLEAWLARADQVLSRRGRYERGLQAQGVVLASSAESVDALRDFDALARLRPAVAAHFETARNLHRTTIGDEQDSWSEAMEDIARIDAYRGLGIMPQLGLVPLGRSQQSGLWEFWHVLSGERPVRDEQLEEHRLGPESGFVLVLLPGGPFAMGAQPSDQRSYKNEKLHRVTLAPFFLSKYEVTQAQWERVMGENPSGLVGRNPFNTALDAEVEFTPLNPVETVSWFECDRFARRLVLTLPTEAQWEYACRAGTATQFSWGAEDASLEWNENVMDLRFGTVFGLKTTANWDDGFRYHAPVGSFAPSGFGLYDMHGNVGEWCADLDVEVYPPDSDVPGSGFQEGGGCRRAFRGGSWYTAPEFSRAAFRQFALPRTANFAVGLRVARALE